LPASKETIQLVKIASKAATDKLGENLVALDVTEPFALAEVFLIISATNERQAQQSLIRLRMNCFNISKD